MVGAEGAGGVRLLRVGEIFQCIQPDETARRIPGLLFGQQCGADRAHDFGIRCAGHLPPGVLFHCAEYGVIAESAALHDNCVAQPVKI